MDIAYIGAYEGMTLCVRNTRNVSLNFFSTCKLKLTQQPVSHSEDCHAAMYKIWKRFRNNDLLLH